MALSYPPEREITGGRMWLSCLLPRATSATDTRSDHVSTWKNRTTPTDQNMYMAGTQVHSKPTSKEQQTRAAQKEAS